MTDGLLDAPDGTDTPTTSRGSVAVVVVLFNSADVVEGLIDSLRDGLAGTDWRLVVVDNDSSDDGVDRVRRAAPGATVIETGRNGGYAAGINVGIAAAPEASAYLVLNPDVRLHPGCVDQLMSTLAQPGTGLAVPRLYDGDDVVIESQRREPSVLRAAGDLLLGASRAGRIGALGEVVARGPVYDVPAVIDWAEGSTLLISRECVERCGPWDESFFLYSEEAEFALRCGDHGLAVRYDPAATATHLEGGSATTPNLWALLVMNRVRMFDKRNGRVRTAAFALTTFMREATRAAAGYATSRAAVRAMLDPSRWRERPGPDSIRRTAAS